MAAANTAPRTFTDEDKAHAVWLIEQQGIAKTRKRLDVGSGTLHRWRNEYEADQDPKGAKPEPQDTKANGKSNANGKSANGKQRTTSHGEQILPGEGMPRAYRRTTAPTTQKVNRKGNKLLVGSIVLELSGYLSAGREGGVYLLPKLSPDKARSLLKRVPKGQRGLRAEHVRAIARDMKRGRFVWTGEPIRLDARGMLIDGQHRLAAAVQSKTTLRDVVLAVVLKKGNIASIDEGAKRNIRDRRSILGKFIIEYSVVASVTYEAGTPEWNSHTRRGASLEEVDDMIDALPWIEEIQVLYHTAKRTYGGRVDSSLGAVAIRAMRKNKKDARIFFTAVAENSHTIDGKECSQVRAACNHMMQMAAAYKEGRRDGDTRRRRTQTTHRMIDAWNAWRSNKKLPSPWRYTKGTIPELI